MRLDGRVGIVTGGASGIEKAIALALAKAGADIAIADLNEPAGQAAVQELEAGGRKALFRKTDVSIREEAKSLVDATVGRFGRLDILVNNAGLQHVAPLHEFPEAK